MEVLNRRERLISFLIFLLLFSITVIIINIAVYFDYHLPWRENAELRKENQIMRKEFDFQKNFSRQLKEVRTYTDSLNASGQDFYYNQQKALSIIINMQQSLPAKDTLVRDDMYDNIIIMSKQLIDTKKIISTLLESKKEIDKLTQQIEVYKQELEKVRGDLEVCRQVSRGS